MGDRLRVSEPRVGAGILIAVLGAILTLAHLAHGLAELGESLAAVLTGVILPLVVSIVLLVSGIWIARRKWHPVNPWRIVGWVLGGIVVAELLAGLLYGYQAAHGVRLEDVVFVFAIHLTYGAVVGLLVGIYDVRIQETRARLSRKTQRLDNFASIVSHDLRNPLNVVEGRVELARETEDVSHLAPLGEAIDRMRTIIRETLTLARQGNEAVTVETVSLASAATGAWEVIETDISTLDVDTDLRVRADPDRLRALLENLFRNAVQHNEGSVTVSVGQLSGDTGFFVADTGDGIPPEAQERVFEGGYSTVGEGTGLGLAIVRAAADSQGWTIALTESESGGARFEVTGVEVIA